MALTPLSATAAGDSHSSGEADPAAKAFFARFKVPAFFHFTDTRNLDSIRRSEGLFSRRELKRRGISIPVPSGDDWSHRTDDRNGLDTYVHLCLVKDHPMEYVARQEGRIDQTRLIKIDPNVLFEEGVRFTGEVANKSGVPLLTIALALESLDFSVIYDWTDWRDPEISKRRASAKKYELLVPVGIPLRLLRGF